MNMKNACINFSVILQFLSLKKMVSDKEHNLADEYYEYKPDDVSFTHLIGRDAIYYCISF